MTAGPRSIPAWRDARRLDRRLGLVLLAGVVGLYATTTFAGLPRGTGFMGVVAWIGLIVTAKLVVMALAIAQRWSVWPALLAEAGALTTIAYIVASQTDQKAFVVVAGGLFAGAVLWRRRAGTDDEDEDEDEETGDGSDPTDAGGDQASGGSSGRDGGAA